MVVMHQVSVTPIVFWPWWDTKQAHNCFFWSQNPKQRLNTERHQILFVPKHRLFWRELCFFVEYFFMKPPLILIIFITYLSNIISNQFIKHRSRLCEMYSVFLIIGLPSTTIIRQKCCQVTSCCGSVCRPCLLPVLANGRTFQTKSWVFPKQRAFQKFCIMAVSWHTDSVALNSWNRDLEYSESIKWPKFTTTSLKAFLPFCIQLTALILSCCYSLLKLSIHSFSLNCPLILFRVML